MGELIHLSERMADRSRPSADCTRFFFAIEDPLSYLAAERVERALGPIDWVPVLGLSFTRDAVADSKERELQARERLLTAELHAESLNLPLVEPHRFPMDGRRAARAAVFASAAGSGAMFALALMRLAFCGGFDIASTPVIEEAAATAGLDPSDAVAASRDPGLDLQLDATSRGLLARGGCTPPAISVGHNWFAGPDAVIAAVSFSATQRLARVPELPVG